MSHHTVALSGMPARGLRLPTRDEIERAARRRDAAALADLDRRVREAMPTDVPLDPELIFAGSDLLALIRRELDRLSSATFSDQGAERARARRRVGGALPVDESLPARVAAARAALDGAREGRQPDADVRARADGVRRDMGGGAR